MVRLHVPDARVVGIPLLWRAPRADAARYRQRHGIPEGVFLFGVVGHLRESKRLLPVLRAFARVSGTALLVAGDFVSSDLERAAAPLLAEPRIYRLPWQRDLWSAAAALDACINLRYPAAGESSDISVQMMGMGKPVLMTDCEENAAFPETTCLRVAAGPGEEHSLWAHMILLTSVAGAASEIGRRAAGYIRKEHSLDRVSARYWNTLCEYRC
jgi:glycosyltransferase involved in cell wall biosynthesis